MLVLVMIDGVLVRKWLLRLIVVMFGRDFLVVVCSLCY